MTTSQLQSKSAGSYFVWPVIFTIAGLALGTAIGWNSTGTAAGALSFLFICSVLAALEISLSFDNAIVNANKLKDMRPEWRRRFLTWGILIAVFGMRIVFPLLIVGLAARLGPLDALTLAATQPDEYSRIMHDASLPISAFGGTFLMMVALTYFFDGKKEIHWVFWLEEKMARSATVRGIEIAFVLILVVFFSRLLPYSHSQVFVNSSIFGLLTFLVVEALGTLIDAGQAALTAARGGLGAFLYLEVLDASFSFDGVIGAFALSSNMFVIAIGLGIGAMYVRAMTILLVDHGTLSEYRFLEHGAFYAILFLSVVMYAQSLVHVPELITGLCGVGVIGLALLSSVKWNKQN